MSVFDKLNDNAQAPAKADPFEKLSAPDVAPAAAPLPADAANVIEDVAAQEREASKKKAEDSEFQQLTSFGTLQVPGARAPKTLEEARLFKAGDLQAYKDFVGKADVVAASEQQKADEDMSGMDSTRKRVSNSLMELSQSISPIQFGPGAQKLGKAVTDFAASITTPMDNEAELQNQIDSAEDEAAKKNPTKPSNFIMALGEALNPKSKLGRSSIINFAQGGTLNLVDELAGALVDISNDEVKLGVGYTDALHEIYGPKSDQSPQEQELRSKYVAALVAQKVMTDATNPTTGDRLKANMREELKATAGAFPVSSFGAQAAAGIAVGGLQAGAAKGVLTPAMKVIGASAEGGIVGAAMVDNPDATGEERLANLAFGMGLGAAIAGIADAPALLKRKVPVQVGGEAELKAIVTGDGKKAAANAVQEGREPDWDALIQEETQPIGDVTKKIGAEGTQPISPARDSQSTQRLTLPKITAPEFADTVITKARPKVKAAFIVTNEQGIVVKLTGDVTDEIQIRDVRDVDAVNAMVKRADVDFAMSDDAIRALARMDLDSVENVSSLIGPRKRKVDVDMGDPDTYAQRQESAMSMMREQMRETPTYFSPAELAKWNVIVKEADGSYKLVPGAEINAQVALLKKAGVQAVVDDVGAPGLAVVSKDGIASPLPDGSGFPTVAKVGKVETSAPVTEELISALRTKKGEELLSSIEKTVSKRGASQPPVAAALSDALPPEAEALLSKPPMKLRAVELDKKAQFLLSDAMIRKYLGVPDDVAREVFNKAVKHTAGENVFRLRPELGGERGLVAVALNQEAAQARIQQALQAVVADRVAQGLAVQQVKAGLDNIRVVPAFELEDFGVSERLAKKAKFLAVSQEVLLPTKDIAQELGKSTEDLAEAAKATGVKLDYGGTQLASKDVAGDIRRLADYFNGQGPTTYNMAPKEIPPFVPPSVEFKKNMSLGEKLDLVEAINPDNVSAYDKESASVVAMYMNSMKNNPRARQVVDSLVNQVAGKAARAPRWFADVIVDQKGIAAAAARKGEILAWSTKLLGAEKETRDLVGKFLQAGKTGDKAALFNKIAQHPKLGQKVAEMMSQVRDQMDFKSAEIKRRTGIDVMATPTDEATKAYTVRMFGAYVLEPGMQQKLLMADEARFTSIVDAAMKDTKLPRHEAELLVQEVALGPLNQADPLAGVGKVGSWRKSLKARKDLPQWYRDALGEIKDGPLMIANTISRQDAILHSLDMWDRIALDTRLAENVRQPPISYGNGNLAFWKQLDNNKAAYGEAAGKWLHPAAHEVLVAQREATSGANDAIRALVGWQKASLVALGGVRAVTTGTLGNMVMAATGNILRPGSMLKFWEDMGRTIEALAEYSKHPSIENPKARLVFDAYRYSAVVPVLGGAETKLAEEVFRQQAVKAAGVKNANWMVKVSTGAYDAMNKVHAKAAELYDLVTDRWWKISSFKHLRDRAMANPMRWMGVDATGMAEAELKDRASRWAALEVRKSFPYPDDVGSVVDASRRSALGILATFGTYAAEDARIWAQLPRRAASEPGHAANLAAWGLAAYAAGSAIGELRRMNGITDEEVDAAKRAQGANRSAGLLAVPMRDSKTGRPILVDLTPYIGVLRFFGGVNGDKTAGRNVAQVAGNLLTAPVAGGFAERAVRQAAGPMLGDVFGFPIDKKTNTTDEGYIQMLQYAAEVGALPKGAVQLLADRQKTLPPGEAGMSDETFYARNLLGLAVPQSVPEQVARQRLAGDLFKVRKDMRSVVQNGKKPLDWINNFVEDSPATLKKTRLENTKKDLEKVKEKRRTFEAGEKAAKESKK